MSIDRHTTRPPVAVVGVSALFPGSVDSTGFWSDILDGTDRMADVPSSHWLIDDHYDGDIFARDKTYGRRGGFLETIDLDVMGFGIPPVAVPSTDTAQLLALIVAQRVLDDAVTGQFSELDRSRASVILGVTSGQELLGAMASRMNRPLWLQGMRRAGVPEDVALAACDEISDLHPQWQESTFPGLLGNVVAGRIANRLDLGGTNCVTDAACASSFSALSMGVNELYLGDSDLVIAGGVDTMNDIFMYMCFSKTPALSQSEDIRAFSDKADGTMLGEGIGMVALKRLADAERDGNHIYCVVNAVGSSSDGRSKSVYAPVSAGQARAISNTYDKSGYGPDTVELIEAHGTGTVAGDAAEFGGLEIAFNASGRTDRQWCALGSVKSQIGHTKAAAGAAGLIKVIMGLHHKVLPQTAKIDQPNPKLNLEASPFHLNTKTRPWVRGTGHERRGSVSSFGFGGSNFHVSMSEYTGSGVHASRLRTADCELIIVSGTDGADIVTQAQEIRNAADHRGSLTWLAQSSQRSYDAGAGARLAIVASDEADLQAKLLAAIGYITSDPARPFSTPSRVHYGVGASSGDVAFVFPGQGSQYLFMASELATQFGAAIGAWDIAAGLDWDAISLQDVVFPITRFEEGAPEAQESLLTETDWAQPAIGTASLSMLRMLRAIGVKPLHVGGHSFGEITALHAAGVLTEVDMLRVARRRGELMAEAAQVDGSMTAVGRSIEEVQVLVDQSGIDVVVANHNHPTQVVLSGATVAIERIESVLAEAGITAKRLPVATAFHSPVVSDASGAFTEFLDTIPFAEATTPVHSNETASPYPTDVAGIRAKLGRQLAQPVRFVEMIEDMYASGARTFVEVGPASTLTGLVAKILGDQEHHAIALDNKAQSGLAAFFSGLGQLVAAGVPMDLDALWSEYADATDPRLVKQPALTIGINGANYGSPYPPADLTELVGPNPVAPPRESALAAASTSAPIDSSSTSTSTSPIATSPIATSPRSEGPTTMVPNPQSVSSSPASHGVYDQTSPPSEASNGFANGVAARPVVLQNSTNGFVASAPAAGVLAAYQAVQQQTAEAHAEYLRTMAQVHGTFLNAAHQSIALLAQMAGGATVGPAQSHHVAMIPASVPVLAPVPAAPAVPAAAPVVPQPVAPVQATMAPPQISPSPAPAPAAPAPATTAPVVPDPVAPTSATTSPVVPDSSPGSVLSSDGLMALLLSVVSDKTGYPPEMLTMGMELEGDLGIDSIKRVEILSAMQDEVPELPEVDTAVMAELVTLGQIVDYMFGEISGGGTPPFDRAAPVDPSDASQPLGRFTIHAVPVPPSGERLPGLASGEIAVTDDGTGIAPHVVRKLGAAGIDAVIVERVAPDSSFSGVIFLGGLRALPDVDAAIAVNREAFVTANALARAIGKSSVFVTVGDLGGSFGVDGADAVGVWAAGLTGLARTAAIEWSSTTVKAIDIERGDRAADVVAEAIVDELLAGGSQLEVGLRADGTRIVLASAVSPVETGSMPLGSDDVIIVSGGGRGVTAATVVELAAATGARFALLGRSTLDDEPAGCTGARDDAALKRVLLDAAVAAGEQITPSALTAQVSAVLACREVNETLEAIERVGGQATYVSVDITDASALASACAGVRSDFGPITGVVHGAGVLADKLIAEKSMSAFDKVFDTKVVGLRTLLDETSADNLKLLCLFSSVAARTGNQGQADYAMANEVLNKVAVAERGRRGPGCVVKSMGWGPWAGGMVSPSLEAHFESMGITLIPLDAGAKMLVDEIASPQIDDVELVLGGDITAGGAPLVLVLDA